MLQKLNTALLLVVLGFSVFLLVRYNQLQKQINGLTISPGEVSIKPLSRDSAGQANNAEVSPFDRPNNDPLAADFPPNTGKPAPLTRIKFEKTTHDFGRIKEGEVVKTKFKFTNIGTEPLIITNARPSCGCTVPSWPKKPVAAGESGEILVEFDSIQKSGEQSKTVTVMANTEPAQIELTIKSIVIPNTD